ncbi:MAG TPA: alanine racemase [Caulobacteraceae bacterium]|nr:alanine racemase [Caulobacteraceae bacterium]
MDISDPILSAFTKGLPAGAGSMRLSDIGRAGWSVLREDLPLPVAVLREPALQANSGWMRRFIERTGARLAPHGKTTMSPQLFARQMEDGAWGLTVATIQQMRVARRAGVRRILLANELAGAREIEELLDELAADDAPDLYALVDSVEGVRRLAQAASARAAGRPLKLLVEMGYPGGRAGCRELHAALDVARAVKAAEPHLALVGVEGFEGLHQSLPAGEAEPQVRAFLGRIVGAAAAIDAEGLFSGEEVILSAGGSAYYDLVAATFAGEAFSRPVASVLRSGCYLTHDAGLYRRLFGEARDRSSLVRGLDGGFENALEIWAYVLSVPEPRRAILGAGRRDFGHDAGAPLPIKTYRRGRDAGPVDLHGSWEIVAINDQHAHMSFPEGAEPAVGDMIALGVSHPCTTFDRWRMVHVVDDAYAVISAIETCF